MAIRKPTKLKTPIKLTKPKVTKANVDRIIHVSTGVVGGSCELCQSGFGTPGLPDFENKVNHYLGHGLTLLHVGQETDEDRDGKRHWQHTVAVLGV